MVNAMSDPMTNSEVEDVLASIRRLVSDDKRTEAEPVQKPANDRLVLTQALRVTEDGPETTADAEPDTLEVSDPLDDSAPLNLADAVLARRIEAVVSEPDAAVKRALFGDDMGGAPDESSDEATPEDANTSPDKEELSSAPGHGHDIADAVSDIAEHVQSADEEDSLFEAGDQEVAHEDDAEHVSEDPVPPEAEDHAEPAEVLDTADPHPPETDQSEPASQSLSEKIAALEKLVGKRSDDFEPAEEGVDEFVSAQPVAMAWEDTDTPPEPEEPNDAEPADEAEGTSPRSFQGEDDIFDEESLRELVSDIVREELQGALGERITRNVRKLVRREIHRALAAQELD